MKTADELIQEIDNELLKLSEVSQDKGAYQYFDFIEAIRYLGDAIKRQGLESNNFYIDKTTKYIGVLRDLLFTTCETIESRIISFDEQTGLLSGEEYSVNGAGLKIVPYTRKIEKGNYWAYRNLELPEKAPSALARVSRLDALLHNCKIDYHAIHDDTMQRPIDWGHFVTIRDFDTVMCDIFPWVDFKQQQWSTFDGYVDGLLRRKVLFDQPAIEPKEKQAIVHEVPNEVKVFGCTYTIDELKRIHGKIKDYIDKDADGFIAILTGKSKGKINWKSDTKTTLYQFIRYLANQVEWTKTGVPSVKMNGPADLKDDKKSMVDFPVAKLRDLFLYNGKEIATKNYGKTKNGLVHFEHIDKLFKEINGGQGDMI